jgi:putative endonuclease
VSGIVRYLYGRLSRLLNGPTRLHVAHGTKLTKIQIGNLGEDIACAQLRANGRKVLYRNYRGPKGGEVDIIARDGGVLSFVEVKTRTRRGYGRPLDAVDASKEALIERGANAWLHMLGTRKIAWRFDVVEIILTDGEVPSIHIVDNAF